MEVFAVNFVFQFLNIVKFLQIIEVENIDLIHFPHNGQK